MSSKELELKISSTTPIYIYIAALFAITEVFGPQEHEHDVGRIGRCSDGQTWGRPGEDKASWGLSFLLCYQNDKCARSQHTICRCLFMGYLQVFGMYQIKYMVGQMIVCREYKKLNSARSPGQDADWSRCGAHQGLSQNTLHFLCQSVDQYQNTSLNLKPFFPKHISSSKHKERKCR